MARELGVRDERVSRRGEGRADTQVRPYEYRRTVRAAEQHRTGAR